MSREKEKSVCTCESEHHEEHPCPYNLEFSDGEDDTPCNCCPYCTGNCADDI